VDPEPMDDFERELREAMRRRPAPLGLKQKILQRRNLGRVRRLPGTWLFQWEPAVGALAAMIVVVVIVVSTVGVLSLRRQAEVNRRGEEAKQQVFTALRITNHALEQMNAQLREQEQNKQ